MSKQADFYNSVYNTAKSLGANDTQAHLAASQASLETGYGKHVAGDNYFGIKAGSSYDGPTVTTGTHEVIGGKSVGMNDTFRQYSGLEDSVAGYMDFMKSRFSDAWNSPNLSSAADNLINGTYGAYATDPVYTDKIKGIADRFDDGVTSLPEEGPFPGIQPGTEMAGLLPAGPQIQQADGIMAAINPAADVPVTQGVLSAPDYGVTASIDSVGNPTDANASVTGLLGGFPSVDVAKSSRSTFSADRLGPAPQGINSPEFASMRAMTENALANMPAYSEPSTTMASAMSAQRDYNPAPAVAAAIPSNVAAGYQQFADTAPAAGLLNLSGTTMVDPLQGTALSAQPASVEAAPVIAEQPQAVVQGPATSEIPAAQPQTVSKPAVSQPAAPAKKEGLLSKAMTSLDLSKEQLAGGLLGGMTLGPIGGLLGALAGRYVANNPGALGSFQNQPMTINNLGTGMQAMQSVYSPNATRGNQFTASNGAVVTARGDGSVDYVSQSGRHEVHGPNGTISPVW